jgi:hypothetical protein
MNSKKILNYLSEGLLVAYGMFLAYMISGDSAVGIVSLIMFLTCWFGGEYILYKRKKDESAGINTKRD